MSIVLIGVLSACSNEAADDASRVVTTPEIRAEQVEPSEPAASRMASEPLAFADSLLDRVPHGGDHLMTSVPMTELEQSTELCPGQARSSADLDVADSALFAVDGPTTTHHVLIREFHTIGATEQLLRGSVEAYERCSSVDTGDGGSIDRSVSPTEDGILEFRTSLSTVDGPVAESYLFARSYGPAVVEIRSVVPTGSQLDRATVMSLFASIGASL